MASAARHRFGLVEVPFRRGVRTKAPSPLRSAGALQNIKRDECASTLVPGSVTKQVSGFQPLRVESLVTLIFWGAATCRRYPLSPPSGSDYGHVLGLQPRTVEASSPVLIVPASFPPILPEVANVATSIAKVSANVMTIAVQVASVAADFLAV